MEVFGTTITLRSDLSSDFHSIICGRIVSEDGVVENGFAARHYRRTGRIDNMVDEGAPDNQ